MKSYKLILFLIIILKLQNERDELAGQIEAEQSWVVDTLLVKIRKLEAEISANHTVRFFAY